MGYQPNPGQSQWPDPNATPGQPGSNPNAQPNYYPPVGYAPPPNYQQQPPVGYPQPPYYPPQPYGYNRLATNRASVGARFVALLIDAILVGIVTSIVLTPFRLAAWRYFDHNVDFWPSNLTSLGQLVVLGIYATLMTVYFGGTIGKRVMNLRVVNLDGSRPTANTLALRYIIGYPISGVFILLGFIWAIFDNQKQAWHDKIANTYVVTA